jgi:hypothetical protein
VTSPTSSRRRPEGRYDAPSRLAARALAVLLGGLFLALIAAIVLALLPRVTGDQVRARVIDFQVLSDSRVRIDLEVAKPEGSTAYCIVRSRGADGAEVGREVVEVDPRGSARRVVRREHDLTTSARAVTGEAGRCSAQPIPERIPTPRPSP